MRHLTLLLALVLLVSCGDRKADAPPRPDNIEDIVPIPPVDTFTDSATLGDDAPEIEDVQVDSALARARNDTSGPPLLRAARAGALSPHPDTSLYTIYYTLSGAPRTGDTVQLRLGRDSTAEWPRYLATAKRTTQRDTASLAINKIYGKRVRLYACVRISYNGVNQPQLEKCSPWFTNFAVPVDTTPPVVDTVTVDSALAIVRLDLKPDQAGPLSQDWTPPRSQANPGMQNATEQLCPFFVFGDGQIALRARDRNNFCIAEYAKFGTAKTRPSAAQQLIADLQCVQWSASGGTIPREVCADTTVRTVPRGALRSAQEGGKG